VSVARGPTRDVVDANGEFLKTLARMTFTAEEWVDAVDAPSPPFALLTIGDLVPEALRSAYEDAGGEVF
jgi:4'-phosphopantetheinyl transferase